MRCPSVTSTISPQLETRQKSLARCVTPHNLDQNPKRRHKEGSLNGPVLNPHQNLAQRRGFFLRAIKIVKPQIGTVQAILEQTEHLRQNIDSSSARIEQLENNEVDNPYLMKDSQRLCCEVPARKHQLPELCSNIKTFKEAWPAPSSNSSPDPCHRPREKTSQLGREIQASQELHPERVGKNDPACSSFNAPDEDRVWEYQLGLQTRGSTAEPALLPFRYEVIETCCTQSTNIVSEVEDMTSNQPTKLWHMRNKGVRSSVKLTPFNRSGPQGL